jgi:hypothetical protein
MDIAANLSGKYTPADVFKQLFHQVAEIETAMAQAGYAKKHT